MSDDINLLPEDLRSKERKELEAASKRPQVEPIPLSRPADDRAPKLAEEPTESLLGRMFRHAPTPAMPKPIAPSQAPKMTPPAPPKPAPIVEMKPPVLPSLPPIKTVPPPTIKSVAAVAPSRPPAPPVPPAPSKPLPPPAQTSPAYPGKIFVPPKDQRPLPHSSFNRPKRDWWAWLRHLLERFHRPARTTLPKMVAPQKPMPAISARPAPTPVQVAPVLPPAPRPVTPITPPAVSAPHPVAHAPAPIHSSPAPAPKPVSQAPVMPAPSRPIVEKIRKGLGINLIPQEFVSAGDEDRGSKIAVMIAGALFGLLILAAAYLAIIWYQLSSVQQVRAVRENIVKLEQQVKSYQDARQRALELQQQLKLVTEVLNSHVYWTQFFGLLEKSTVNDVYYQSFAMSGTHEVSLQAIGHDYVTVARQLAAFEKADDLVQRVDVNGATAKPNITTGLIDHVLFTIDLVLQPTVFFDPLP